MTGLIMAIALWCSAPYGVESIAGKAQEACRASMIKCVDPKKPDTIWDCALKTKP